VPRGQAVDGRSVRWGQAPLAFELNSSDPKVLGRAAIVFRPWMAPPVHPPHRSWSVERSASGEWLVCDARNSAPIARPTVKAAVRAVEFLAVNDLLASPEATTLHAALVARGEHAIAILGGPEAGKSTLAVALWQCGWSVLGDDLMVVDPVRVRAWPAPRRVGLRFTSRSLLGETAWRRILQTPACDVTEDGCLFHPDEVEARPGFSRVRLAALVFLEHRGAAIKPACARPLPPALALLAVLPYTNAVRRADVGTVIRHFHPLLTGLPAYHLGRGPIGAMTAAVERLFQKTVE
jgi:hypothetical protein